MKRHFVSTVFLVAFLAAPALAAEMSKAAGSVAGAAASKDTKRAAAKKKPAADKPMKVAKVESRGSNAKSPLKTTRRMRGYGN